MHRSHIARSIATLAALSFAAIGVALWIAPEAAAVPFGLTPVGTDGLTTLRADLGGLFIGLALLAGAAAKDRRRPFFLAAAALLAAVGMGRIIGLLANGASAGQLAALAAELGLATALVVLTRAPSTDAPRTPTRRGWIVGGALVAAVLALALATNSSWVLQRVFDGAAQRMTATVNTAPFTDDALRVAVCGSSAPLPSASRAKACVAVFAGGKYYIVDTGPESTENLVLWGIPLARIGGIFLTHFHSDHIGDLGELQIQSWAGGRDAPLRVYGGPGIAGVVKGFNDAYRLDQGYRTTHHGEQVMPSATWGMVAHTVELDGAPTPALDRSAVVFDDGGLRVTAIEVDHAPIAPSYAYRFDYKGRSVVVTGDLKYHPPLADAARGADLLVSEAIAVNLTRSLGRAATGAGRTGTAAIMHDIEDYHNTPEQAAQTANDAGVRLLAFYHLLPAADGLVMRRLFAQGVNDVRPTGWTIADDGSMYTLPIGSTDVRIGRVRD